MRSSIIFSLSYVNPFLNHAQMFFSDLAFFAAGIINESVERNIAYPQSLTICREWDAPE
jgi:hypothetical protein